MDNMVAMPLCDMLNTSSLNFEGTTKSGALSTCTPLTTQAHFLNSILGCLGVLSCPYGQMVVCTEVHEQNTVQVQVGQAVSPIHTLPSHTVFANMNIEISQLDNRFTR